MKPDRLDRTDPAPGGSEPGNDLAPGVRTLDHTADVGITIRAPSLPRLFERAASGMAALVFGGPVAGRAGRTGERAVDLAADDVADLLALWLRELLYLQEVDDFTPAAVRFDELGERRLRARVVGGSTGMTPVREIKGVTYHGLEVERTDGGWRARVIFDV